MLVIPQPAVSGALPQPNGPPSPATKAKQSTSGALDLRDAIPFGAGSSSQLPPQRTGREGALPKRQSGFRRTTSMFQTGAAGGAFSSRSSSPLSSAPSLCASPSAGASTSTPASTVASTSSQSSTLSRSRAQSKREPYVDIENARRGKTKAQQLDAVDDPAAIQYDVPANTAIPAFARDSTSRQRDLGRVWEAVASARRIVVVSGAGVSVSSPANIPDFRSAAGLFRKLKEKHPNAGLSSGKDLFDANLFKSPSTSALFYSMVAELKALADAAAPTSFHHLLRRLDLEGRLMRVYTQNIDGLEEKAGISFGLGQTGDSRAALRALGKRKRDTAREAASPLQRKGGMARSKSDSAVLFSRDDTDYSKPMFPRSIPLHGSLSTMTCQICGHKVYLSLASSGQQNQPRIERELSPDAGNQATAAMDLLSQGEPVSCKQCEAHAEVRSVAGLRSRGVGLMKVDVVLYNGQNEGAERVGDCVERDILGLRDPNETLVPESHRERLMRERRERKEERVLEPIVEATSPNDTFAALYREDDEEAAQIERELTPPGATTSSAPRVGASRGGRAGIAKPKRQPRLKPLPPDLLIVAGTSLKVPGTKRIVREFAKACRARDHRVYESSDEDSDEESSTRKTRSQRSRSTTPAASGRRKPAGKASRGNEGSDAESGSQEEGGDDIHAPIRTILLNYDFPLPYSSWEDVFDVWVQGDVQQASLGLWDASKYPGDATISDFSMRADDNQDLSQAGFSWAQFCNVLLEEERKAAKKAASRKNDSQSASASQSSLASGAGKGKASRGKADASIQTGKPSATKKASASKKAAPRTFAVTTAKGASGKKTPAASPKKNSKATAMSEGRGSRGVAGSPVKKKQKPAAEPRTASSATHLPPKMGSLDKSVKKSKATSMTAASAARSVGAQSKKGAAGAA